MELKIHHITAIGTNHRCMFLELNGSLIWAPLTDSQYELLKACGVPTAQKLRWEKQKTLKTKEVTNSH